MHQYLNYRGPERRGEKRPQKIFEEIIAEKLPNLVKETVTQVQEVQRIPIGLTQIGIHQDTS